MNESDLTNVVNELERGHRAFKAFEYGLDAARAVQNLAQVERETQARIDALKRHEEAAQYALITANEDLATAKANAEALVDAAVKAAADAKAGARAEATAIVGAATEQADSIKATVDRLRVEYTELQRNVSDRAAELADLEGRIAKARATAAAIMGGAALPPVPPPAERIEPAPVTDDEE